MTQPSNDPAFRIEHIDTNTGETTIVIKKGILGAMSNQLKQTARHRKGARILQKLGYVLSDCGNVQYGKKIEETNLSPELLKNGRNM